MNIDSRHLVVQTSTIDPASSRRFCAKVRATGARYLESPFTGSKPAAESRTTVFYLGGDPADVAAAEPVLSRISQARRVIGTPEQAAAFKLSQNLLIASYAEALCESLRFARAAGISDDTYFATLRLTVAWNGFTALKEPKLRTGDYSTQFSVKHMLKDMRLALLAGDRSLPITKAVTDCLQRAADAGLGNEDFIALYKTLGA
jgi:3-hydroxyisobutyrate dehydrogenase-like beta-hydroxyacid dehydrogenase